MDLFECLNRSVGYQLILWLYELFYIMTYFSTFSESDRKVALLIYLACICGLAIVVLIALCIYFYKRTSADKKPRLERIEGPVGAPLTRDGPSDEQVSKSRATTVSNAPRFGANPLAKPAFPKLKHDDWVIKVQSVSWLFFPLSRIYQRSE